MGGGRGRCRDIRQGGGFKETGRWQGMPFGHRQGCRGTAAYWMYCCLLDVLLLTGCTAAYRMYCCLLDVLLLTGCTAAYWMYCCSLDVLLLTGCTAAYWMYCCSLDVLLLTGCTAVHWMYRDALLLTPQKGVGEQLLRWGASYRKTH